MSGFGPKATELAARIGDGYINTAPDDELLNDVQGEVRRQARQAGAKVAYAPTAEEGWEHAHRLWPNAGLPGEMAQVLPTPEHFEQASRARDDGVDPGVRRGRQRPRRSTSSRSRSTPTPGTTSSTSRTWARTSSDMIALLRRQGAATRCAETRLEPAVWRPGRRGTEPGTHGSWLRRKSPLADIDENTSRSDARRRTAAGVPGVAVAMKRSLESMGPVRTARTLLKLNQTDGFDCQGCAWPDPDPDHRHTAEFCENGAKAVAEEATTDHIGAGLLRRAQHRGPAGAHRLLARPPGPAGAPDGAAPRRARTTSRSPGTTRSR